MLSKNALVSTQPPQTVHAFFQQRIRWASKAAFYDDKRIFWVLLIVYLFNVWIFLLGVLSPFWQDALWSLGALLIIKTLVEWWFIWPVAKFFNKTKWMWTFPLLQPFHIVYTLIAGWLGRFGHYEWKGRTIRNA